MMDAISVSKSTKMGTLRWAAPEMFGTDASDPARRSPAVDIFALGVVIGEVCLLSLHFDTRTILGVSVFAAVSHCAC